MSLCKMFFINITTNSKIIIHYFMSTFAEYIATSHENALYAVKDLELNSSEYT